MIKMKVKYFILGMIFSLILGISFATFADSAYQTISVNFDVIKVRVNGKEVIKPNILYNGTTYVPLRAVSEMLNKDVIWNGEFMIAYINNKENEITYGKITKTTAIYEGGIQYEKINGYGMLDVYDGSTKGTMIGKFINGIFNEGVMKLSSTDIVYMKNGSVVGKVILN